MIYLKRSADAQYICIPKTRNASGELMLTLRNKINNNAFFFTSVDSNSSWLYHMVMILLSDNMPNGEYEYTLVDNKGLLSSGIMVVGDQENIVEYNNTIEYEQYEE